MNWFPSLRRSKLPDVRSSPLSRPRPHLDVIHFRVSSLFLSACSFCQSNDPPRTLLGIPYDAILVRALKVTGMNQHAITIDRNLDGEFSQAPVVTHVF